MTRRAADEKISPSGKENGMGEHELEHSSLSFESLNNNINTVDNFKGEMRNWAKRRGWHLVQALG